MRSTPTEASRRARPADSAASLSSRALQQSPFSRQFRLQFFRGRTFHKSFSSVPADSTAKVASTILATPKSITSLTCSTARNPPPNCSGIWIARPVNQSQDQLEKGHCFLLHWRRALLLMNMNGRNSSVRGLLVLKINGRISLFYPVNSSLKRCVHLRLDDGGYPFGLGASLTHCPAH
jgi:hypothetical protein